MLEIVSILQWLAKFLLGGRFTETSAPRLRRPDEAFEVCVRSGGDHWPGVGWMKVRLMLEQLGGLPCRRMAPVRVPNNQRVNPRAKPIHCERFLPETSPPSYLRNCFSPPDFPGM
jgi:hypothetical protein